MYSGRATARSASDMEVVGAARNQPRERVQEGGGADGEVEADGDREDNM